MGNHDELLRKRELREEGVDPYVAPAAPDDDALLLANIKRSARVVRRAHKKYEGAVMKERNSAAELLTKALDLASPALPALVGKIECRTLKQDGVQTQKAHYEEPGVLLVDNFKMIDHERGDLDRRDQSGIYTGNGLYWLADGDLAIGTRSGTWSKRPGEVTELIVALNLVDEAGALVKFRIEDILQGLANLLAKQERLGELAGGARARAARLQAALAVLQEPIA